jgi:hypothetical protein
MAKRSALQTSVQDAAISGFEPNSGPVGFVLRAHAAEQFPLLQYFSYCDPVRKQAIQLDRSKGAMANDRAGD